MISVAQRRGVRILIVEDEQVVAMDVEAQLEAFGFEVVGLASSGEDAIQLAASGKPDIVLIDVQLRGAMDGFCAARAIQEKRRTPVIFVSAFGNGGARQRAAESGAFGYLTKPYRPQTLLEAIDFALAEFGTSCQDPQL